MLAQINTYPENTSVTHSNSLETNNRTLHHQIRLVDTPGDRFASEVVAGALKVAVTGRRVLVVQILKGGIRQGHDCVVNLAQNLDWIRCNSIRNISAPDLDDLELDNFQQLWQHVRRVSSTGEYSLIILDGLSRAIDLGLVGIEVATAFLAQLPHNVEIVLTDPNHHPAILELTCN